MHIHFIRHLFVTLTYDHTDSMEGSWRTVSKSYNRYILSLRRLHGCNVEYLRTIEAQQNGYAHVHAIIQFPDARIRVENHKFFDRTLYARWRGLWPKGFSDYQVPIGRGTSQLNYIMKYITKNATVRTVWKKLIPLDVNSVESQSQNQSMDNSETVMEHFDSYVPPVSKNGVKLCTWSRRFDFSPFVIQSS